MPSRWKKDSIKITGRVEQNTLRKILNQELRGANFRPDPSLQPKAEVLLSEPYSRENFHNLTGPEYERDLESALEFWKRFNPLNQAIFAAEHSLTDEEKIFIRLLKACDCLHYHIERRGDEYGEKLKLRSSAISTPTKQNR